MEHLQKVGNITKNRKVGLKNQGKNYYQIVSFIQLIEKPYIF